MIVLNTSYSMTEVPYLTNDVLERFAEKLIADFSPNYLYTPFPIDADRFLEFYLRLNVEYKNISYNKKILGMTAFNDGNVKIMNDETRRIEDIYVTTGTVIIDNSLNFKRNTHRRRFTLMHEGSHWMLHKRAYSDSNPFGSAGIYENKYIAAKAGNDDYPRSQKERSDNERMERQADFLASAILMPRPALRTAFCNFFYLYGDKPHRLIRGINPVDNYYVDKLPIYISKIFNVSKHAALIRLEKLTAIKYLRHLHY